MGNKVWVEVHIDVFVIRAPVSSIWYKVVFKARSNVEMLLLIYNFDFVMMYERLKKRNQQFYFWKKKLKLKIQFQEWNQNITTSREPMQNQQFWMMCMYLTRS